MSSQPPSEILRLDQLRPEDRGIVPTSRASCGGRQQPGHPTDRLGDHRTVAAPQTASPSVNTQGGPDLKKSKIGFLLGIKSEGSAFFSALFLFKVDGISDSVLFNEINITEEKLYHYIFYLHIFFLISSMQCQKDT